MCSWCSCLHFSADAYSSGFQSLDTTRHNAVRHDILLFTPLPCLYIFNLSHLSFSCTVEWARILEEDTETPWPSVLNCIGAGSVRSRTRTSCHVCLVACDRSEAHSDLHVTVHTDSYCKVNLEAIQSVVTVPVESVQLSEMTRVARAGLPLGTVMCETTPQTTAESEIYRVSARTFGDKDHDENAWHSVIRERSPL